MGAKQGRTGRREPASIPRKRSRDARAREDPSPRLLAIQAAIEGFRRASGTLHKLTRSASGGEFGLADAFLLHFIEVGGSRTPSKIAAFTGLTSGSVTSLVDRLERAGYVHRERSAEDRRVVLISLAPKAREALTSLMTYAHREIEEMFSAWTTDEIVTFALLLAKFGRDEETGDPVRPSPKKDAVEGAGPARAALGRPRRIPSADAKLKPP